MINMNILYMFILYDPMILSIKQVALTLSGHPHKLRNI